MKKFTAIILVLVSCVCLLTGCGSSYDADESTVFILKDGKVVVTDVQSFDENTYDQDSLKTYVKDEISAYNGEYGSNSVKLKNLSVSDGTAKLMLEYASAEDYVRFYGKYLGIELFSGSMAEALAAGYTFDADFASISDGQAQACSVSEFYGNDDYKVAVIKANLNVQIKGTICFVSTANVAEAGSDLVVIRNGADLLASGETGEEEQDVTEAVDATEAVETDAAPVDDGSVSDDELLVGEEESAEVMFEFKDAAAEEKSGEFSNIYTYIIYK